MKTVLVPQCYDMSSRRKLLYNYGVNPRKHGKSRSTDAAAKLPSLFRIRIEQSNVGREQSTLMIPYVSPSLTQAAWIWVRVTLGAKIAFPIFLVV
ncbi:hypothetical protein D910_07265 [Dendroctonus ponderosae]|uniref:Uncharacterized protein n=1 Tax=Dendroctonus ponderosae TaxID=77166 RepID=U4UH45_DENPD|nr:hypothetical protein D910_07265 [Dendroctonus ponderosae]